MAKDDSSDDNKLLSLFDSDSLIAEEKLLRMRKKLILYFSRELHSSADDSEDCADETIIRVIKKLSEGVEITNEIETDGIERYIFGVAKFVKMEFWRRQKFESIDDFTTDAKTSDNPEIEIFELWEQEEILSCYRKCLAEFNDAEQNLFGSYYNPPPGEKPKDARENLAELLGLSRPILKKRAFRLRERLEACMKNCLDPDGTKLKKLHL
jgi:RNA polymerase sigma factor (sigma-70 family)